MKTKKKATKLKKSTIYELNNDKLNTINGGSFTVFLESIIRVTTYGTWIDNGPL